MNNLEAALRRALAKGNMNDPAFRRKVYSAAANAMEKSLESNPSATEDMLVARRKGLAALISGIEDEIESQLTVSAADPAPSLAPPVASVDPGLPLAAERRSEPRLDSEPSLPPDPLLPDGGLRAEPAFSAGAGPDEGDLSGAAADTDKRGRRKRHPFAAGLSVLVAIAAVIIGFIFVWTTGAFQSAEERDTSVPNPAPRLEAESSPGSTPRAPALAAEGTAEERAAAEGWVTVFSPDDPTSLSLSRGAEAAIQSDPFGDYARLVTPAADSEVFIDIPVGTLNDLQGGLVQVNIVARADEGQSTEMSVTCDLAELGDCGRRRFIVGQSPAEYLFRIDMPDVGTVQNGGIIKLRADINENSQALNLLAVRLRAANR